MASKRSDRDVDTSTTTPAALMELATHAIDLLARDQLDPRFARKLWKRLSNEAGCVKDQSGERPSAIDETLDKLKRAVTDHQAGDLVHAAAALREEPEKNERKAKN
jgi:hypothetical protein